MKFNYTTVKDGKTVTLSAEAVSREALMTSLNHQGIHAVSVKEAGKGGGSSLKFCKKKKVDQRNHQDVSNEKPPILKLVFIYV